MKNGLLTSMKENGLFLLQALFIAVAIVLVAYLTEKIIKKKNNDTERVLSTRKVVVIGVFSAVAAVLMLFEFPLPFVPGFYTAGDCNKGMLQAAKAVYEGAVAGSSAAKYVRDKKKN